MSKKKLAIVTMSFKEDFKECELLCKSIDIFVPEEIVHYIFVPDKDYHLFQAYDYGQHKIRKESEILPKWLIKLPFKVAGRHFHVSPFTFPVRGWIIQQICKLGIFEVIDEDIDAVFNCDSESVFIQPFNYDYLVKGENYAMYQSDSSYPPGHEDFCKAAKHLLRINDDISSISQHDYITELVCFERENVTKLLNGIASNHIFGNWKMALCNTKRFSEYYLYGIYTGMMQSGNNHFLIDKKIFYQISVDEYNSKDLFENKIRDVMPDSEIIGLWLQKTSRRKLSHTYLDFDAKKSVLESIWKSTTQLS